MAATGPAATEAAIPDTGRAARLPVHGYVVVGATLLAGLLLQQLAGWRWPWLAALQADDLYKQLSGCMLVGFIAHQWYFPLLRASGRTVRAAQAGAMHKLAGAAVPLLFLVHAQQPGHAYTVALSLMLFGIFLTGLANPENLRLQHPAARTAWTVAHVGLATALPFVVAAHVYLSYAFE